MFLYTVVRCLLLCDCIIVNAIFVATVLVSMLCYVNCMISEDMPMLDRGSRPASDITFQRSTPRPWARLKRAIATPR